MLSDRVFLPGGCWLFLSEAKNGSSSLSLTARCVRLTEHTPTSLTSAPGARPPLGSPGTGQALLGPFVLFLAALLSP